MTIDRSRAICAMAALGTAISTYLVWVHYSGSLALCIGVGGCEAVQTSRYSMIGPVPVAAIGLAGFLLLLGIALARVASPRPELDVALFAVSLAATLYVVYLTYIEIFVLGAICPWCVSVALCAIAIFTVIAWELLFSRQPS